MAKHAGTHQQQRRFDALVLLDWRHIGRSLTLHRVPVGPVGFVKPQPFLVNINEKASVEPGDAALLDLRSVRSVRPPTHAARFAAVLGLALQLFAGETKALQLSRAL